MKKPKRERAKVLMDQKATSIADLAAALKLRKDAKEDVEIHWQNLYDAEYAEEWPSDVVHHLAKPAERYTAPVPETRKKRSITPETSSLPPATELGPAQMVKVIEDPPEPQPKESQAEAGEATEGKKTIL